MVPSAKAAPCPVPGQEGMGTVLVWAGMVDFPQDKLWAVVWSCDHTGVFQSVLSWAHTTEAFSAPRPTSEGAGGTQGVWGDTPGTAEPSWPKGYFRPYGLVLCMQSWGKGEKRGCSELGHLPSPTTIT